MLKFTKEHEWVHVEGDIGTVGITQHAQEQLGELVFVELPAVGKHLAKGAASAVLESVKAASELYAPVSGEVTEANSELAANPSLVNSDPMGAGWFFKLKFANPSEINALLEEADYQALLG